MAWRPLLEGTLARDARSEVERIARVLDSSRPLDPTLGPSLLVGTAGPALFFAYAHRCSPSRGYLEQSERWLERAADLLGSGAFPLSLYNGAAGFAWVVHHLTELVGVEAEQDIAATVDELVLERVGEQPWSGPIDLVDGLAGFGVYLLSRAAGSAAAAEALSEVVTRLAELASRRPGGTTWSTNDAPGRSPGVGVAHGVASLLFVLAGAVARKRNEAAARELLEGAMRWLLALRQPAGCASVFPYDGGDSDPSWQEARLAWCHGDGGIAATLHAVALRSRQPRWRREAEQVAHRAAERSLESSGVEDPGLCHGAAGLGHLFNRLFQATGSERLARCARTWFEHALRLRRQHPEGGGYPRLRQAPKDFLGGASGVGLALLAATSDIAPGWDQLLCASYPEDPG